MVSYRYYHDTFTGSDTGKPITTAKNLVLKGVDIQVQTNGAYIGGRADQSTKLSVGDILSYGAEIPVRLMDIWYKNQSAGSNTVLSITGWIVE